MMADWDLPYFSRMAGCARVLQAGFWYHRFQQELRAGAFAEEAPSPAAAAQRFLRARGKTICEYEAAELLALYGITSGSQLAASEDDAVAAAEELGWPVALKVQSPDIPHKTEAKALALGIVDGAALRRAYREVMANARAHAPAADLRGVLVQKMAPPGIELIAGVAQDADFGPIMMCGLGGIYAEIFADVAFAPAPISLPQADAMIGKLKAARLLAGVRGALPKDRAAFADLLVRLSRLAWDTRDLIAEIDLNPVIVHETGLTVVDALIVQKDKT
jgi:acyl-CoA synthetase (NDP forming)